MDRMDKQRSDIPGTGGDCGGVQPASTDATIPDANSGGDFDGIAPIGDGDGAIKLSYYSAVAYRDLDGYAVPIHIDAVYRVSGHYRATKHLNAEHCEITDTWTLECLDSHPNDRGHQS